MSEIEVKMSDLPICDFCSDPNPVRRFAAVSFEIPMSDSITAESRGAWVACEVCAVFVDRGEWEELARRATGALYLKYRGLLSRAELRAQVDLAHAGFRKAAVNE